MNLLRNILFYLALIIVFPIMIIGQILLVAYFAIVKATDERKKLLHRFIQKSTYRLMKSIPGVTIKVENPHNETFERPAIIVCNHQSHLDLTCLMMLSPQLIFMAKKWVWMNPLYCILIRYADFISSEDDLDKNITQIGRMAEKGYSTVIFPEGTRSASCKMQRFHRGAFHTAEVLQMDILPITLHGTGKVMNKKTHTLSSGEITIYIHHRIAYDAKVAYAQRAKEVKQLIEQQYNALETGKNDTCETHK